jgi:hypothetical protein
MRGQPFLILLSPLVSGFLSISYPNSAKRQVLSDTCRLVKVAETQPKDDEGSNGEREPTPRSTAVFALMESLKKKKPSFATRQLENDPEYQRLDRRDRAFSRLLLATTERRQGQIDKVIRKFMNSKKSQVSKKQECLRSVRDLLSPSLK